MAAGTLNPESAWGDSTTALLTGKHNHTQNLQVK
jgi:hypothetical protein